VSGFCTSSAIRKVKG